LQKLSSIDTLKNIVSSVEGRPILVVRASEMELISVLCSSTCNIVKKRQ